MIRIKYGLIVVVLSIIMVFLWSYLGETEQETQLKESEEIVLKIYAQYSDDDTIIPFDYAVEALKEAYPQVRLELDIQMQDDGQKLQTYAATGNLPDIFQVGGQQIESFKESGNIMILNEVAEKMGFTQRLLNESTDILYHEDGNIYAFPYAGDELVVWYYNKALFEKYHLEVPRTFDELKEVIKVFKKNDIIPMACFAKEKWITASFYDVLATRYDVRGILKLDEGELTTLSPAYEEATKVMGELIQEGLFSENALTLNYEEAAELFYEGKAAMMLNGQWEIQVANEKMGEDVAWMYYPSYDLMSYEEGKKHWAGGGTIGGYGVNPHSEHKELAAEVAAFITMKYCEAKVLYRGNPFVTLQVHTPEEVDYPPMMKEIILATESIESTTRFTWGLRSAVLKTGIEDQTQLLFTGQYKAEEFIEAMNKVLEQMKE